MISFINASSLRDWAPRAQSATSHIVGRIHTAIQGILGKQLGTITTGIIIAVALCTALYGLYKMIAIIQNQCCGKQKINKNNNENKNNLNNVITTTSITTTPSIIPNTMRQILNNHKNSQLIIDITSSDPNKDSLKFIIDPSTCDFSKVDTILKEQMQSLLDQGYSKMVIIPVDSSGKTITDLPILQIQSDPNGQCLMNTQQLNTPLLNSKRIVKLIKGLSNVKPPKIVTQFSSLPNDLYINIMQFIERRRDFISLMLVNKQSYVNGQNKIGHNYSIPSYLDQHPDIRKLQNSKEKWVINNKIEETLFSSKPLEPLLHITDSSYFDVGAEANDSGLPQTIVGDYFVIAQGRGICHIHGLNPTNKKTLSFQAHGADGYMTCTSLSLKTPLLATINSQDGVKIWNIDQLFQLKKPSPIFHDKTQNIRCSPISESTYRHPEDASPVIDTDPDHQLLAVGYQQQIVVMDCSNPEKILQTNCPFKDVIQIQFSEKHLMLVSSTSIAIWQKSTILEAIKNKTSVSLESAISQLTFTDNEDIKNQKIRLAKLYKSFVIIAYEQKFNSKKEGFWVIGEVKNWQTGKQLRTLDVTMGTTNKILLNSMDVFEDVLYGTSSVQCQWDLTNTIDSKDVMERGIRGYRIHQVHVLGNSILFAEECYGLFLTKKNQGLEFLTSRVISPDGKMISYEDEKNWDKVSQKDLIRLRLYGPYLITEARRCKGKSRVNQERMFNVYKLA